MPTSKLKPQTKSKSSKKDYSKRVDSIVDAMRGAFKNEDIVQIFESGDTQFDPSTFPVSLGIDIAIGVGGLPRGRISEIFGQESSGKTLFALTSIANSQAIDPDCVVGYVDMEHALDPQWAAKIGVDLSRMIISQPDSGEQALSVAEKFIQAGCDIVVVDSVAALVPQAEISGDIGDSHVGLQARLMSHALRKINTQIKQSQCSLIFINQLREKIGVMFGNPNVTSGGKSLKFYASLRFEIKRVQSIKDGGDVVGQRTKLSVKKNKIAAPYKETEFDIMYDGAGDERGFSFSGELIDLAEKYDIIKKRGAWYSWVDEDENIAQGREKFKAVLSSDAVMTKRICDALSTKVQLGDIYERYFKRRFENNRIPDEFGVIEHHDESDYPDAYDEKDESES